MKHFKLKKKSATKIEKPKCKKRIFKGYRDLKNKAEVLYDTIRRRIKGSVRLEIVFISAVCLVAAMGVFVILSSLINETDLGRNDYVTYDENRARVQDKLLNAVNQINNLENAKLKIEVDLVRLNDIMAQTQEEAINGLARYINNAWHIEYGEDKIYQGEFYTNKYSSSIGDVEVRSLYDGLQELRIKSTWDDKHVREQLEEFYTQQGITESLFKQEIIKETIRQVDQDTYEVMNTNTYLINGKGNIMYQEGFIESLDIVKVIKKANSNSTYTGENNAFTSIYPVIYDNEVYYLFNDSILKGNIHYYYTGMGNFIGAIGGAIVFIVLLFKFTKRKIAYIEYLSYCLGEISKGDLAYEVEIVGEDELAKVARDITHMENEIKLQIEAQMRAEKVKNELITNVAHDLRTPLTSIIGYIGLVKDKHFTTQEEQDKYLDIAYAKSEKLKVLIEDLFEYTKLHNREVKLKKENMSVTNLINQLIEELMPLAEDKQIIMQTHIEAKDTTIKADIQKLTRVFENLIENAIKYSQDGSTIYVDIKELGEDVFVEVKNRCTYLPQGDIDRLFDRFYRADESRSSMAGGSGLGLAIAKNIVKLHGGQIGAKLQGDLISFNVRLHK